MTARRNPILILIILLVHFGSAAANDEASDFKAQNIGVLIEWIEVDHALANQLLHQFAAEPTATSLRNSLEKKLDAGKAELVESSYLVRSSHNSRARIENTHESIYPTEYSLPDLPTLVGKKQPKPIQFDVPPEELGFSVDPIEFEVRNTGTMLEFEPELKSTGEIHLLIYSERVRRGPDRLHGDRKFSLSGTSQPSFLVTKIATSVDVPSGKDMLLDLATPAAKKDKRVFVILRTTILE